MNDIRLLPTDKFIDALDRELAVPPGRGLRAAAKATTVLRKTVLKRYVAGPIEWQDKEGHVWQWKDNQWTLM